MRTSEYRFAVNYLRFSLGTFILTSVVLLCIALPDRESVPAAIKSTPADTKLFVLYRRYRDGEALTRGEYEYLHTQLDDVSLRRFFTHEWKVPESEIIEVLLADYTIQLTVPISEYHPKKLELDINTPPLGLPVLEDDSPLE